MCSALVKPTRPHFRERTSVVARDIDHCVAAWSGAYQQALEYQFPEDKALRMAAVAYKLKIPKMVNVSSVKSAFACIAHGISLEVFDGNQASQLLYSVQVATRLYSQKGAKK